MNRVLVTGGAGTIGAAVVRRLLSDPRFEVRVSDQRTAPQWMREGCEIHQGDLRELDEARRATQGCTHVIHLAAIVGGIGNFHKLPHTLTEVNNALYNGVIRAALDHDVERFVYVSSSMVFERATEFPTTEEHILDTPIPQSAYGFSKLTGEVYVKAAHDEHGFPYTICRPFNAYGPGEMPEDEPGIAHMVPDVIKKCLALPEGAPLPIFGDGTQTRTLTHIDDIADGIVVSMASEAGLHEDFNISAGEEMTVAEIARVIWEECDRPAGSSSRWSTCRRTRSTSCAAGRRVEKAERLLGWKAQIGVREGVRQTADWLRGVLPAAPGSAIRMATLSLRRQQDQEAARGQRGLQGLVGCLDVPEGPRRLGRRARGRRRSPCPPPPSAPPRSSPRGTPRTPTTPTRAAGVEQRRPPRSRRRRLILPPGPPTPAGQAPSSA